MLQNTLFTIKNISHEEENIYIAEVQLDPDHEIFKGHFPEQPILPGVCLIEIVREILSEITHSSILLNQAQNIKFLKIVNPVENGTLKLHFDTYKKDNLIHTNVTSFLMDGSPNFKLKAAYSFDEGEENI